MRARDEIAARVMSARACRYAAVLATAACSLLAPGCDAAPDASRAGTTNDVVAPPDARDPPFYLATLLRERAEYPQAGMGGTFRIVDGCAMLGDDLLVLRPGAVATIDAAGEPIVRLVDPILTVSPPLAPGTTLVGGGGQFPLASVIGPEPDLPLAEPVPARCAALSTRVSLVAPAYVRPRSAYADRLYVAVLAAELPMPREARVRGRLNVRNQCLMLDGDLLALAPGSSAAFDSAGRLRIALAGKTARGLVASPGDRLAGTGARAPLSAIADRLGGPPPPRCRTSAVVMLGSEPTRIDEGPDTYGDVGSRDAVIAPPPPPPPPPPSTTAAMTPAIGDVLRAPYRRAGAG